jgi:hypothetical protein
MKITRLFAVLLVFSTVPQAHAQDGVLKIQSAVSFSKIARLERLTVRDKSFSARCVIPVFRARTPLARFANAQIAASQKGAFRGWVTRAREILKNNPTSLPYEYRSVPSLSFYSPTLISLRFDSYQFMGGAHGLANMQTRNFAIVNGKPKELVLGDLFRPGTNYRALVEQKVFANLRRNPGAMWVHDKSVKKLENSQFNNFTITQNALTWLFNEYEVGPYSNGQFEVKIMKSELGLAPPAK